MQIADIAQVNMYQDPNLPTSYQRFHHGRARILKSGELMYKKPVEELPPTLFYPITTHHLKQYGMHDMTRRTYSVSNNYSTDSMILAR